MMGAVALACRRGKALSRLADRSRLAAKLESRGFATPSFDRYNARTPPYPKIVDNYDKVRHVLGRARPLTLAEKIVYSHLENAEESLLTNTNGGRDIRGNANLKLKPDRVAMQDASAQMALLQFMTCQLPSTAVPASIHCDHLIVGERGAKDDLEAGIGHNKEVFAFLESAAKKYGIEFWPPGAGIIHQSVLENYAAPGLMMLGTDSHTPNAGGMSTIAIGVGGADAVEALVGAPWELKAPRLLGVQLEGKLQGWASPKDVILHLAGKLTVRGGTGFIIEYFGPGVDSLSLTGMSTITNMGAEVGATTSIFPFGPAHVRYLKATHRHDVAAEAQKFHDVVGLRADDGAQYDEMITIDLSSLEPHINGPFTPDLSIPLSQFKTVVQEQSWPEKLSAGLIGSCTNSSYEDMTRVEGMVREAIAAGIKPVADFYITPGSDQIRETLARDGPLDTFKAAGGTILSNACGPCIGQWNRRDGVEKGTNNAILTSFNRNFRGRNDGNPDTMNFLASPEIVTAMAFAGSTTFNPVTDSLTTPSGDEFRFTPPSGLETPSQPFAPGRPEFRSLVQSPDPSEPVAISPTSDRLAVLEPFDPFPSSELSGLRVLVKVGGKCTTDTISAAGPWLKYKGHLPNISANTLNTATNAETGEVNAAYDLDGSKHTIPELARRWKDAARPWLLVAEHNYGEGSAREHAALQPRYLGARIVLSKSFARIHETNLKKQGVVPLTFADEADYGRIKAGDAVETVGLYQMLLNRGQGAVSLKVTPNKASSPADGRRGTVQAGSGESFEIKTRHSISKDQALFILAGSALNLLSQGSK